LVNVIITPGRTDTSLYYPPDPDWRCQPSFYRHRLPYGSRLWPKDGWI